MQRSPTSLDLADGLLETPLRIGSPGSARALCCLVLFLKSRGGDLTQHVCGRMVGNGHERRPDAGTG